MKIRIQQPPVTGAVPGSPPFLRLGFRPFYFGAALFAVLAMVSWYGVFLGQLVPASGLAPVLWHAHEMLFGFAAAVIIGFLLTAGKAWTGLPTPRGAGLGALFVLWAGARIAALAAPYPVFFALDVALLPVVSALFIAVLVRAGNTRNLKIGAVLALLGVANLVFHLAASGAVALDPVRALYAGLALIIVLETIMGGRVIPSFTMNATPGLKLAAAPKRDAAVAVLTVLGLACWSFNGPPKVAAGLLAVAAIMHVVRWLSWMPWVTLTRPILWILHVSYVWIPIGLALLAAAQLGWIPASGGIHALAVGATGGLIIGMLTRTARGHTGRPLKASPVEACAYVLVLAAAAVRVAVPIAWPSLYMAALLVAGGLWVAGFAIYLVKYTPWLMTARLDGKDG
jgi:uncharacterized protein involved in response to NO